MAIIIKTTEMDLSSYGRDWTLWMYNGLDCMVTKELFHEMEPELKPETTRRTYEFEKLLLRPAMQMMNRGFLVDQTKVAKLLYGDKDAVLDTDHEDGKLVAAREFRRRKDGVIKTAQRIGGMAKDSSGKGVVVNENAIIQKFAKAIWGRTINYNSPTQLKKILYTNLCVPPQYAFKKGKRTVSTEREALEYIAKAFPRARVLCRTLLTLRDLEKKISVLSTPLDADGRMRCSFNVAGTETGRWSSSSSVFDTGTNLQNITKDLREIFIPDPGYVMFYADLEQAESRGVAYLSGDEDYIEACEGPDLHTTVCKMVWPNLPWNGDNNHDKKEVAESPFYRSYSYRDMSKRGGHGTNYFGTPTTMAKHLKVEVKVMKRFQSLYYGGELDVASIKRWKYEDLLQQGTIIGTGNDAILQIPGAFPGIRLWHDRIADTLQQTGKLITPLGRERQFWGRLRDLSTLRKAIAFVPQSSIGDILNMGLYRVWSKLEPQGLQLLGQVHDAIVGQVPIGSEEYWTPKVLDCLEINVPVGDRVMRIPSTIDFGVNWKEAS